ncbi:hypothetical protein APSETT445_000047 [Aspergillus pseudonomiae]
MPKYKKKCTFDWLLSHSHIASRHGHSKRARNVAIARSRQANDHSARSSQQASIGRNPAEDPQQNAENCGRSMSVWDPFLPLPQDEGLNADWLTWANLNGTAFVSPVSDDMIVNSNSHVDVDHTPPMTAQWTSPGACQDWHITDQTALLDMVSNSIASSQSNGTPGTQPFRSCGVNSELSLYDVPPTEVYAASLPTNTTLRVCLLDRAYSSIPGRRLTSVENRTATQVLHAAIMAFASQWLEERSLDKYIRIPATALHQRRGMREGFWNQARHALEQSRAIPSFRVAFAHMLISLTQPPLHFEEGVELGGLIDHDPAPIYLEMALRQMFTFRSTLIKLQRQGPNRALEHSCKGSPCEEYNTGQSTHQSGQVDVMLKNSEAQHTFDLLFWLGIMFDTLTSVIYQRPPVISDEDSQIIRTRSPIFSFPDAVDLDGWDIGSSSICKSKESVWGDLFLRKRNMLHNINQARWPCSYEEAAEVLSDAAPVKVLLFRRITHINTLVCRLGEAEAIEEAIHNALLVYEYWNSTYEQFMLDCLSHHTELPSRIQSWYLVLAGHWYLAAMLLADTLEDIDQARLGLDSQATYRSTTGVISRLRRESAFAVGDLAQYSYDLQDSSHPKLRNFHDSVNQAASLTEPWAAVLIHSFRKAGTILTREIDISQSDYQMQQESFMLACQRCEHCIKALQCLGKKSDMALIAAQRLLDSVNSTLSRPNPIDLYNMGAL